VAAPPGTPENVYGRGDKPQWRPRGARAKCCRSDLVERLLQARGFLAFLVLSLGLRLSFLRPADDLGAFLVGPGKCLVYLPNQALGFFLGNPKLDYVLVKLDLPPCLAKLSCSAV
jgi:hypothetical protein